MLDLAHPWPLRIAFVFGDAALAAHVRDALAAQAQLVYTAAATEFDAARIVAGQVDAVLVNLDIGDSLDALGDQLAAVGVRVVFNDPAISSALEGWPRARWLRHLLAKLRGDTNFDPPRPVARGVRTARAEHPVVLPAPTARTLPQVTAVELPGEVITREARTVSTAPFAVPELGKWVSPSVTVAVPETEAAAKPVEATVVAPEGIDTNTTVPTVAATDAVAPLSAALAFAASSACAAATGELAGAGALEVPEVLDVDTQALSAMVDAQLAGAATEPEAALEPLWSMATAEPVRDAAAEAAAVTHGTQEEGPVPPASSRDVGLATDVDAAATVEAIDAADSWAGLPAVDDWKLVEPDAADPSVAARHKHATPALAEADFPNLELVPMGSVESTAPSGDDLRKRWSDGTDSTAAKNGGKA